MGFLNKLRHFVSPNAAQKTESDKLEIREDPSFKYSQEHPLENDFQFEERRADPFGDLDVAEFDESVPVLDGDWELYEPKNYKQDLVNNHSQVSDHSPHDLEANEVAPNEQLDLDPLSSISDEYLQEIEPDSLDLGLDPLEMSSSMDANLLPETEMISEIDPPHLFGGLSHNTPAKSETSDQHLKDMGSVFIPASHRVDRHAPPRLSLALVPISIPSPLSYALVFRDEIERLQTAPDTESNTNQLIELYRQYTSLVPNDIGIWSTYSETLIETHGLEYAYNQVKRALGKTRDDTAHLLMLADMSRRMCDTHAAWHYISILNDLHPNNIEVLEQLRDIQRECKFFELAQNTDAHIQQLYQNQQPQLITENNFPLNTRD